MAADYTLFIEDAQKAAAATGVPASVTLGQLILESSGKYENGLSFLGANYNNLFGVKGTGSAGSVSLPTTEYVNGQYKQVNANFRAYNTAYESILDHNKLLQTDRYTSYTKDATTVGEYVSGIHKAGYATDPNYTTKVLNVIDQYNLTQYDDGSISGNTNHADASTNDSDSGKGFIQSMYFNIVRTSVIIGIAIIAILFFLKAFPAAGDVAEKATNVIPIKKVVKVAKKAKTLKKVAK